MINYLLIYIIFHLFYSMGAMLIQYGDDNNNTELTEEDHIFCIQCIKYGPIALLIVLCN